MSAGRVRFVCGEGLKHDAASGYERFDNVGQERAGRREGEREHVKPKDSTTSEAAGLDTAGLDATWLAVAPALARSSLDSTLGDAAPRTLPSGSDRASAVVGRNGGDMPAFPVGQDEAPLPLTREQKIALSRRIHTALEQASPRAATRARADAAVQDAADDVRDAGSTAALPAEPPPRRSDPPSGRPSDAPPLRRSDPPLFKQTMLLGLSPLVEPERPRVETSEQAALRASFVRVVGPPTTPPPRRSRRSTPQDPQDAAAAESQSLIEPQTLEEAELLPSSNQSGDHEAFSLHRPIVTPALAQAAAEARRVSSAPPTAREPESELPAASGPYASVLQGGGAIAPPPQLRIPFAPPLAGHPSLPPQGPPVYVPALQAAGVILPPPPGASDYAPASSPPAARVPLPPHARAAVPLHNELPSVDPFAGFVAPPASVLQRWGMVVVLALALFGLVALVAISLGLLGKTG